MSSLPAPEISPQRIGDEPPERSIRFHVTWRVFDTVQQMDDVARMQRTVIAVMERCQSSPRVLAHGMFADARGGFVIADVETPEQLMELFAGMHDLAHLDVHPLARTESGLRFLRGMLASEAWG